VLTLKAAGLVDIDAGSIVRPGILRIDGDRIAAVGGPVSPDDEVIDLGSLILPPRADGHGSQPADGRTWRARAPLPRQDDPPLRMPGLLPLSVEEGIADGVSEVRRALVLDGLLGSARELTREAGARLVAERPAPRLVDL
jgi:hypothetical protein